MTLKNTCIQTGTAVTLKKSTKIPGHLPLFCVGRAELNQSKSHLQHAFIHPSIIPFLQIRKQKSPSCTTTFCALYKQEIPFKDCVICMFWAQSGTKKLGCLQFCFVAFLEELISRQISEPNESKELTRCKNVEDVSSDIRLFWCFVAHTGSCFHQNSAT